MTDDQEGSMSNKQLHVLEVLHKGGFLSSVQVRSKLLDQIETRKFNDAKLLKIYDKVLQGEAKVAILDYKDILRIRGEFVAPR